VAASCPVGYSPRFYRGDRTRTCGGEVHDGVPFTIYDQDILSPRVRARTTYPFFRKGTFHLPGRTIHTTRLERVGTRPIAHQGVIDLSQALAILYGSDDETKEPTDEGLALMMVIASDFVPEWGCNDDDDPAWSPAERNLVEGARVLQYNQHDYRTHGLVRGYRILSPAPPRTPEWRDAGDWAEFQRSAFGMDFDEYSRARLPLAAYLVRRAHHRVEVQEGVERLDLPAELARDVELEQRAENVSVRPRQPRARGRHTRAVVRPVGSRVAPTRDSKRR
jgi:hypothetical protein